MAIPINFKVNTFYFNIFRIIQQFICSLQNDKLKLLRICIIF